MTTLQPTQPVQPVAQPTPLTPEQPHSEAKTPSEAQQGGVGIEPITQKKSPLIAIMAILLILTTGAAAYFYSQSRNTTFQPKIDPPLVDTTQSQPTTSAIALASADPTVDWQTYTNNKLGISFKIPTNWANYSMNDFSVQAFTKDEDQLYLGPTQGNQKPPQLMQLTSYKANGYQEQEVFPPENCTITNTFVGVDKTPSIHKICKGMESNGFITVRTDQYVFIIDEIKGNDEDHQLFTQILQTFQFTD